LRPGNCLTNLSELVLFGASELLERYRFILNNVVDGISVSAWIPELMLLQTALNLVPGYTTEFHAPRRESDRVTQGANADNPG